MTAPSSIDPARFLHEHLASASPDLLRQMLTTFINTLMSAEADAVCGAGYGEVSPTGPTCATATGTASSTPAGDPDLYSRIEFGWFLGALTIGLTVGGVLPVDWWVKLLIGLALALVLLPLLGWLSGPLGRVLRFLLVPVLPKPEVRLTGGVRVTGGGRVGALEQRERCARVAARVEVGAGVAEQPRLFASGVVELPVGVGGGQDVGEQVLPHRPHPGVVPHIPRERGLQEADHGRRPPSDG
jgi:hypothetical protein